MTAAITGRWLGCAAALSIVAAAPARTAEHRYVSTAGFSVSYPATWHARDRSATDLLIVSPGRGAQGPVIGPNQAAIRVRMLDGDGGEAAIPPDARPMPAPAGGDCRTLARKEVRDDDGPGPGQIVSSLYCRAKGRIVLIQLTRWADDPRRAAYLRTAAAVAASVRVGGPVSRNVGAS